MKAGKYSSGTCSLDSLARALNLRHRDGLDMMGGADGEALEELISEFMAPGSED